MNLLTIGSDRKLFEEGSAVSARHIKYGESLDRLDMIVFAKRNLGLKVKKLDPKVTVYPTNSWSRFLYFIDAYFIARSLHRPDIVSAQDPFESGVAGYLVSRHFGVPLHLQAHTDFLSPYFYKDSYLNKVRLVLARFLIRRSAKFRVVSERIKRSIVASGLKDADSIIVEPIFVDTDKIRNATVRIDLHKKYPQFEFIILMASRITKEKNIGLAIEAMVEVVKKYPKVGLVIVGDGPERNSLELKIKNEELSAKIIFENWSDDLPSYYKTADLFLLTSNYEGYGMTIIEALSVGLPVVMSDVGCAGEVLINGQNGLVFPVGDLQGLILAIEKNITATQ